MRNPMSMIALVFAMILCLLLGLAVVGVVAIPARREGRDVLTPRGEDVVSRVKERTEAAATVAKGRTGDLVSSTKAKGRTGDLVSTPKAKVADPAARRDADQTKETREAT
jgi:hypothetical protein